jgi:hypothetical protein
MYNSAFAPFGATYQVGTSPVQVISNNNMYPTGYRIVNLTANLVRFSYAPQEPNNATVTPSVTAPAAGAPQANTLAIPANGVAVFSSIPPNAWFIASAATSLEITPGEGIN